MSRQHTPAPALAPAPQTADEAALSEAYTPLLRHIAARSDLTVRVASPTTAIAAVEARNGEPVRALSVYWPDPNTIELDSSLIDASVNAASINPRRFGDLAKIPQLHGLACHEAAHAAHTRFDATVLCEEGPAVRAAALLLEDIRAERRLLQRRPPDAFWLRAAARSLLRFELVNTGILNWDAGKVAVLTCGRVDAGSLEEGDVVSARSAAADALGDQLFEELHRLWRKALTLDDGDQPALMALARRWCRVLEVPLDVDPDEGAPADEVTLDVPADTGPDAEAGEDTARQQDGPPGGSKGSAEDAGSPAESDDASAAPGDASDDINDEPAEGPGDPDDDTGEGSGDGADDKVDDGSEDSLHDALREALRQVGNDTTQAAEEDATEQGEIQEDAAQAQEEIKEARKASASQQEADTAERKELAKASDEVFDDPFHGMSPAGHAAALTGWRAPTGAEKSAASTLARSLEQHLWRPPEQDRLTSVLPPGRLHTRGAMAQSVQISLGKPLTAKPWRRTVRTPEPPLRIVVGLGIDRSGSMSGIIGSACSAAWVVSAAIKKVSGRFASVTFGEETEALTRPGTTPPQVPQLAANAGFETIGSAIAALDGALSLRDQRTIRLLCIVSDGHWVNDGERTHAERQLAKLASSGCGLLLCNTGDVNDDVPYMRKLRLDQPSLMAASLAEEIIAALRTA